MPIVKDSIALADQIKKQTVKKLEKVIGRSVVKSGIELNDDTLILGKGLYYLLEQFSLQIDKSNMVEVSEYATVMGCLCEILDRHEEGQK